MLVVVGLYLQEVHVLTNMYPVVFVEISVSKYRCRKTMPSTRMADSSRLHMGYREYAQVVSLFPEANIHARRFVGVFILIIPHRYQY